MAIADIVGTSGIQWNAHSTSVLQTQRKSVTNLEAKGYPPATFVMHLSDVESLDLALLSTSDVEFQGPPFDATRRTSLGLLLRLPTLRRLVLRTLSQSWSTTEICSGWLSVVEWVQATAQSIARRSRKT